MALKPPAQPLRTFWYMIRTPLKEKGIGRSDQFRWRGGDVSRLEGFSDAVFGFALTLLVVSLEVPRTFDALMDAMRGFFSFGICFASLAFVWYRHYLFFRRYGLQDSPTVFLNLLLLFVILFYVYPLKFCFSLVTGGLHDIKMPDGSVQHVITAQQVPMMFIIYGSGYAAVFFLFALLNMHAWRKREILDLNEIERLETRESIASNISMTTVGLASVAISLWGGTAAFFATLPYWTIGLLEMFIGTWYGNQKRRFLAQQRAEFAERPDALEEP